MCFVVSLTQYQPCVWRNVQGIIFVPVSHCKSKICYHCCPIVPETDFDEDGDDDVNDDIDASSDGQDTVSGEDNNEIRRFHE